MVLMAYCTTIHLMKIKTKKWKGSGGGMLDKFVSTDFGGEVSKQCASRFLGDLPSKTKLVVMFGMGTNQNYVRESYKLFQLAIPSNWRWLKEGISYTNDKITVVHVEHFASQGSLIPKWLGEIKDDRSRLGDMARSSVEHALKVTT